MRVNRFVLPIVIIVALLGTALAAQAAGLWSTSGRDTTNLANMTPADIKGWMTLQQVMDGLSISQAELYPLAGIPADVLPGTALKDLESLVPDFSITILRDKLMARATGNVPAAPTGSTVTATPIASPTAAAVPQATPTHAAGSGDGVGTGPSPLPAGQILPVDQIKGKLTLQQVSDQCAVPLDALLAELGLPATTNPDGALKDLVAQGTLTDVTQVQTAVAKLQGK